MTGEVKALTFAQGTAVTAAPTTVFSNATSLINYANDAAYVAAKGSAAAEGDLYAQTTVDKIRWYNGTTWLSINDTLDNFTAGSPTTGDDSADFYSIGSKWLNTSTGEWFFANDVTVGAAVWKTLVDKETAQTISGQKTFSTALLVSDTTESSSKDTGSLILEGGLGVEKNAYIGGNLVVTGDFTVNGTNTIINTTVLDVEDVNITLNNGGNKAAADGFAGLIVEMSDATHVSLIYDSTLASRWKIGDLASEAQVATISHTQTFTNKTLYDNTVSFADSDSPTRVARFDCGSITAGQTRVFTLPDLTDTLVTLTATQSLTNKTLDDSTTLFSNTASPTKLAYFSCASITAGQTRVVTIPDTNLTLVGTSITQTLTNKLLDGGTASASNLWKLPGDTLANLTGLARVEKAIYYDETNNRLLYDDGATLNAVGGGGAGGGIQLIWRNDGAVLESTRYNQLAYDFEAGTAQRVYTSFKVPSGYTTGKQITLKLKIASPTGSGNGLIKALATLIQYGVHDLASTAKQRTTTNSTQAIAAANTEYEIVLDISDGSAQIGGTAMSAGDTVLIEVYRDTDTNTDVVYFFPSVAEVYVTP